LGRVIQENKFLDNERPFGAAVRFNDFKFIKQVHNLRELVFPNKIISEFDISKPPPEMGNENSINTTDPYDKPLKLGSFDYWLFDVEQDPTERFNLLRDPTFFPENRMYFIQEFDNILERESRDMVSPPVRTRKPQKQTGAVINGTWTTGWCDTEALHQNKLYFQL